jgi:hypothetical protein
VNGFRWIWWTIWDDPILAFCATILCLSCISTVSVVILTLTFG